MSYVEIVHKGNPISELARAVVQASVAIAVFAGLPANGAELTARDVTETVFRADARHPPDFSSRKLGALDLSGLDFKAARLAGADLYGADLSTANLSGTDLSGARLDRATMIGTDFSGANLAGATILRPTLFSSLDIKTSEAPRFHGANMTGTRIVAGRLDGTDFTAANMTRAVLGPQDHAWGEERYAHRAVMIGCDFSGATLLDANLVNGIFHFAKFRDADLTGAQLNGADLSKADLTGANLTGADLTGANVEDANLTGVRGFATVHGLDTIRNLDKAIR